MQIAIAALALGFQAPGAFVARPARSVVMAEEPFEPEQRASDIFTLQDREDGWDDVRGSIKEAIKQREGPYNLVKEKYVEPTARWTKAAVEVASESLGATPTIDVKGMVGSVTPTNLELPKVSLSAPKIDTKSAINTLAGVLDAAGDARERKALGSQPKKQPTKPVGAIATANSALFFGVPAAGITATLLYLFTSEYFS